jgi:hypothetical protein
VVKVMIGTGLLSDLQHFRLILLVAQVLGTSTPAKRDPSEA